MMRRVLAGVLVLGATLPLAGCVKTVLVFKTCSGTEGVYEVFTEDTETKERTLTGHRMVAFDENCPPRNGK